MLKFKKLRILQDSNQRPPAILFRQSNQWANLRGANKLHKFLECDTLGIVGSLGLTTIRTFKCDNVKIKRFLIGIRSLIDKLAIFYQLYKISRLSPTETEVIFYLFVAIMCMVVATIRFNPRILGCVHLNLLFERNWVNR